MILELHKEQKFDSEGGVDASIKVDSTSNFVIII